MVKIISIILASISILLGVLFIIGSFSDSTLSWLLIGGILVTIGAVIMWIGTRQKSKASDDSQNVTLNIDLPGNISLDTLKCEYCGGNLTAENIKMVAGAPVVTCPYCHTTYQLTEKPKW
ncbi:MAG: hypothetical protein WBV22_03390 [Anaerolineaceae bacterium]